jgi:hypothetical protein
VGGYKSIIEVEEEEEEKKRNEMERICTSPNFKLQTPEFEKP